MLAAGTPYPQPFGGRRDGRDAQHPGVARAREYLATYAARDMVSLRDFFTDDVVWHVAGKHPLSGDYRGKDSLVDCR